MVSDPVMMNGDLDSLVLGGLQVFGVPSLPLCVLANGKNVSDFTYQADTKVSFLINTLGGFSTSHAATLTKTRLCVSSRRS